MMTINRRSDKLGWSIHPEGGLHDLSRERADDRESTQADSPQSHLLSGADPGARCQCGHGAHMTVARRFPTTTPVAPSVSTKPCRCWDGCGRTGWSTWILSGWLLRQTVFSQLVARLSIGNWFGCSATALAVATAPASSAGALPRLSPGVHPYRYLCPATPGRALAISVFCGDRSVHAHDDHAGRLGTGHGQCSRLPGSLPGVLSVPPLSNADRQQAGRYVLERHFNVHRPYKLMGGNTPAQLTQEWYATSFKRFLRQPVGSFTTW